MTDDVLAVLAELTARERPHWSRVCYCDGSSVPFGWNGLPPWLIR